MNPFPRRRKTAVRLLAALLALGLAATAGTVRAGERHREEYRNGRPSHSDRRAYHPVRVGKQQYFYRGGRFFRHHRRGYAAVAAPVGAVVAFLPPGFRIVLSGRTRYYCFGDVYYRPHPRGYRVVPAPVAFDPPPRDRDRDDPPSRFSREIPDRTWITVTAEVLNVRSGPGREHPVVGRVRQGRRLEVEGHAPGWSYVRLPHGEAGWVMNRFTTGIVRRAEG